MGSFTRWSTRNQVDDRASEGHRMTAGQVPGGVFAPVATIFTDDGELDLDGFSSNLEVYASSDLDGVVILGSNGEYALLDTEEKLRLIETGVKAIGGRKVVM